MEAARKPKSREVIERLLWDRRIRREDYLLYYVHRGVEGERKGLPLTRVLNVKGSWISFLEDGEERRIPLHRVVEIVNIRSGEKLWVKTSQP